MIADDRDTPLELAVKMITAPAWVSIYFAWVCCRKAAQTWSNRKPKPVEPEVLTPVQPAWLPTRDIERAVYAALILAGEPSLSACTETRSPVSDGGVFSLLTGH